MLRARRPSQCRRCLVVPGVGGGIPGEEYRCQVFLMCLVYKRVRMDQRHEGIVYTATFWRLSFNTWPAIILNSQ
jgi:hypothetical protein